MGGVVSRKALTSDDVPELKVRRRLIWAGLGGAAWLVYLFLARHPGLAEAVAGSGPLPEVVRGLSLLTGFFPVPLAELVVVAVLGRQVLGAWRGMTLLRRGEARARRLFASGGLRLMQDVGIVVLLFYVTWGFQYARPGLEARLGMEAGGEVHAAELERLASRAVAHANELYLDIHGSPDAGAPTRSPPIRALVPGLEEGWRRVTADYGLETRIGRTHGEPKRFLASSLFRRFGTAGMYFPFTGEALVLGDLPAVITGTTVAHEMAHQRGFSSETDANTLAVLVARESPDPVARYAGGVMLQRQLLGALRRADPERAGSVERDRIPGVERDLAALSRFWEPARGTAGRAATRVNDAMLRSHGIPDGVASYAGSAWVFVALARERGEDALF